MKNGCTLCGGRVVGGICRECGWDNRKNDAKYRLNIHNAKGVRLHADDCDTHMNQDCEATKQMKNNSSKPTRARREQLKQRHQTGTAQKKQSIFWKLLKWFIILAILADVLPALRYM